MIQFKPSPLKNLKRSFKPKTVLHAAFAIVVGIIGLEVCLSGIAFSNQCVRLKFQIHNPSGAFLTFKTTGCNGDPLSFQLGIGSFEEEYHSIKLGAKIKVDREVGLSEFLPVPKEDIQDRRVESNDKSYNCKWGGTAGGQWCWFEK